MTDSIPHKQQIPKWITDNVPSDLTNDTLFKFEVTLSTTDPSTQKPRKIKVNLLPDLTVDYDNLEFSVQDLPAQYAFWSSVYSESRNMVSSAERLVKARRAHAVQHVQSKAAEDKIRLTGDQVKQIVEADDQVLKAEAILRKHQLATGKLYHMLEAIKMKADLCRTLAGFKRQEYQ